MYVGLHVRIYALISLLFIYFMMSSTAVSKFMVVETSAAEKLCCRKSVKSLIQGFLPGIALKIFLILLPTLLMIMSKIEGFSSLSSLERRSAAKYHLFLLVNVFLGSIITGTALEQLKSFLNKSATEYVSPLNLSFINMVQYTAI